VKSYTQLLARRYQGRLDSTADEFIAYAVEGCDRMGELIHDVLEYSRVGRKEQRTVVELEEVLAVARQNLEVAIAESGARIVVERLPRLHCRRSDLVMLLQNLLSNALEYRRAGASPQIHVGVQRREAEDVLFVSDDGIGIDTSRHGDRIFGMFARLHARGEYGGTGMGLALCKKIMETHGGRIWVESAPGRGATFFCAFPRGDEGRVGHGHGGSRPSGSAS
jgi:light-regulated signal transduction histidine kinase (bacteriophytochrome)